LNFSAVLDQASIALSQASPFNHDIDITPISKRQTQTSGMVHLTTLHCESEGRKKRKIVTGGVLTAGSYKQIA
jgi:hypothetical protein